MNKTIIEYICPKCKKVYKETEARGYDFKCVDCVPMYSIGLDKTYKKVSSDKGY